MDQNENYLQSEYGTSLQRHAIRTFGWMTLGLLVTAIVAFFVSTTNLVLVIFANPFMPWILLIVQIGVVVSLVGRIMKISPTNAKLLFLLYSILTGVTFSVLGLSYGLGTLALAFLVTSVYFGSLVLIGMTTKMNLLRFGPIIMGGLIALIVTEVIMMFMGVGISSMAFAAVGLLLFTVITAYDAQKMKALYTQYEGDEIMLKRLSIYSAFDLYLDFINIFIYILRFLGNRD